MHTCKFFTTFVPDMRKRIYILGLLMLMCVCAHAETILLRTGARVKGTIVFQNEEVVIIREEASGERFQYPRADVEAILDDQTSTGETEQQQESDQNPEIKVSKKATILLELAGGLSFLPAQPIGGAASVDLLVGSHHIGDRHLFIGGGVGYHGVFMKGEKYNFIPLLAALRMPLIEHKHAPFFGVSAGYGIALSNDYIGGIFAGLDFGYRCQLNPKTALSVGLYVQFQQATIKVTETIENVRFINNTGRGIVNTGIKLAFYF